MGTLNGVVMNSTSKPDPELARQFLQAVRTWLIEQQQGLDTAGEQRQPVELKSEEQVVMA